MRKIKLRAWQYNQMVQVSTITFDTFAAPLMQYTGLKDKNGVEIYEGDILRRENMIYEVEWDVERVGLEPFTSGDGWGRKVPAEECLIIGNIYNNPELAK